MKSTGYAVGGRVRAHAKRSKQQIQANARRPMHSVKRFTTSACRISFRCQGDVIIDVSRLASFSERSK